MQVDGRMRANQRRRLPHHERVVARCEGPVDGARRIATSIGAHVLGFARSRSPRTGWRAIPSGFAQAMRLKGKRGKLRPDDRLALNFERSSRFPDAERKLGGQIKRTTRVDASLGRNERPMEVAGRVSAHGGERRARCIGNIREPILGTFNRQSPHRHRPAVPNYSMHVYRKILHAASRPKLHHASHGAHGNPRPGDAENQDRSEQEAERERMRSDEDPAQQTGRRGCRQHSQRTAQEEEPFRLRLHHG